MVRGVEREGATAGGRREAPLAKPEQKLKRCRISFINEDDVQRQEEGAVVVRVVVRKKAAAFGGHRHERGE